MSGGAKFSWLRRNAFAGIALIAGAVTAGAPTVAAWAQSYSYTQQTAPNYSYQPAAPSYSYQQPYGSSNSYYQQPYGSASYPNYSTQAPAYQGGYSYNPYWSGSAWSPYYSAWG